MKIKWLETAYETGYSNFYYIAQDKPKIAFKIIDEAIGTIQTLPEVYKQQRPMAENIYSTLFYKRKFRILYEIDEINDILYVHAILSVRQSAEKFIKSIRS